MQDTAGNVVVGAAYDVGYTYDMIAPTFTASLYPDNVIHVKFYESTTVYDADMLSSYVVTVNGISETIVDVTRWGNLDFNVTLQNSSLFDGDEGEIVIDVATSTIYDASIYINNGYHSNYAVSSPVSVRSQPFDVRPPTFTASLETDNVILVQFTETNSLVGANLTSSYNVTIGGQEVTVADVTLVSGMDYNAVSYTHLTLPTILLV